MFLFYLFLFIAIIILTAVAWAAMSLAPWIPVRSKDLPRVFKLANLQSGEKFYDLGCGDGKVVLYAAKNFSVQATGIELAWPFFLISKLRQKLSRQKNLQIKLKNLFKVSLADADVIYVFGLPATLQEKFIKKINQEVKAGTRVISYAFKITGWTPDIIDKPTENDLTIYLYQV